MLKHLPQWLTPNRLTTFRVFLIPGIYVVIWMGRDNRTLLFVAMLMFLLAGITDYMDGAIARLRNTSSDFGKLVDPIADKMLVSSILVLLVSLDRAPALAVALLIGREFAVSGLRSIAVVKGVVIQASSGGKWKTISQMVSIGFLITHYDTFGLPCRTLGLILLWVATAVAMVSGFRYFAAYHKANPISISG